MKELTIIEKNRIRRIFDAIAEMDSSNISTMQGGWTEYGDFVVEDDIVTVKRFWHTNDPFQSGETTDKYKIIRKNGQIFDLTEWVLGID